MTDRTELRRLMDAYRTAPNTDAAVDAYQEYREAAVNALPSLLDQLDAAEAALARVRELHRPYKVYDECDCDDDAKDDGWHVEVEDVGLTCNQLYTACDECCTEGMDYITEHCAGCHDHGPDKPRCPTIAALGGEQS